MVAKFVVHALTYAISRFSTLPSSSSFRSPLRPRGGAVGAAAHQRTHKAGSKIAAPNGIDAIVLTAVSEKKVFIRTFGCQMNEYDSAKMADVLGASHAMVPTDSPQDADLILFNTCSVREKAQEKVFSDLGRIRHLKGKRPELLIGVGGCVASQEGARIIERAPFVDLVFGPQTLHRLPAMIEQRRASGRPQVDISFPEVEKFDALPLPRVEGVTAFVSIMEG